MWKFWCLSLKGVFTLLFAIVLYGEKEPDALKLSNYMFLGWLYIQCEWMFELT